MNVFDGMYCRVSEVIVKVVEADHTERMALVNYPGGMREYIPFEELTDYEQ